MASAPSIRVWSTAHKTEHGVLWCEVDGGGEGSDDVTGQTVNQRSKLPTWPCLLSLCASSMEARITGGAALN